MVKIINCGVPPRGWQVEYGLEVNGSLISKSQGWPSGNMLQQAEEEARKLGLRYYRDEFGKRVHLIDRTSQSMPSDQDGVHQPARGALPRWGDAPGSTQGGTSMQNMRSGDFPDALCVATVSGFVISIPLPKHPDAPEADNLYPKEIEGMHPERWLEKQPGVVHVFRYRQGASVIDVVVIGSYSAEEQANYAQKLQDALNAAGFQW